MSSRHQCRRIVRLAPWSIQVVDCTANLNIVVQKDCPVDSRMATTQSQTSDLMNRTLWMAYGIKEQNSNSLYQYFFFILAQQPPVGQDLLIHEVSRSHTTYHTWQDSSGQGISPSQRPLPDNTQHSQQTTSMPPVEFDPTISAGERPQTYALDRAATGTGVPVFITYMFFTGQVVHNFFTFFPLTFFTNLSLNLYKYIFSFSRNIRDECNENPNHTSLNENYVGPCICLRTL